MKEKCVLGYKVDIENVICCAMSQHGHLSKGSLQEKQHEKKLQPSRKLLENHEVNHASTCECFDHTEQQVIRALPRLKAMGL